MGFNAFLKQNAVQAEEIKYVASPRFKREDGTSEEWIIRPISSKDDEELRKACTKKVQVPGKRGQYTNETDFDKYLGMLAVACTKYPNLNDAELQDSYNDPTNGIIVKDAPTLLKTMLLPGEYAEYLGKVQEICGFDIPLDDKVEEVKNS